MPRPIWKGHISFGLVNIPVILYPAEKTANIQFKLVDGRDKAPIHYLRINERTGKEVPWPDVAKAYEYDEHRFVLIKEEEIKKIAGENSRTIDIENFVDRNKLDYVDFEKPYYLVPDKKGEKGYVILREALSATKKIGIAKVIIHTRQYLAAVLPYENSLVLELLRYHQDIRKPAEFEIPTANTKAYKVTAKELQVAKQLIESMTTSWRPDKYEDEFQSALEKWIEAKIRHEKPQRMKQHAIAAKKSNVVDFVALLKKSLAEKNTHKSKHAARR